MPGWVDSSPSEKRLSGPQNGPGVDARRPVVASVHERTRPPGVWSRPVVGGKLPAEWVRSAVDPAQAGVVRTRVAGEERGRDPRRDARA
jgi:hypothetical protein